MARLKYKWVRIAALSLVMLGTKLLPAQPGIGVGVGVSINYQTFYDELSPHGRWIDFPEHGYVWQPNLGNDFRPYSTGGRWVWNDQYEWMWASDYSWGWAPFHYGRWFYDDFYGWLWVPGYEWGPAWVTWRNGGGYYGWAPLRPGINISIGFNFGGYNPPMNYWCFVPNRYIYSRSIFNHCLPWRNNQVIFNNTIIINNYNFRSNNRFYCSGPLRRDFERYTGRITPVRFVEVNNYNRSGFRNNQINVYRPGIQNNGNNFSPRNVERYNNNNGVTRGAVAQNGNNLPSRRYNPDDNRNAGYNNNNRQGIANPSMGDNTPNRPGMENDDRRNNGNRNNLPERRYNPDTRRTEEADARPGNGSFRNQSDRTPERGGGNNNDRTPDNRFSQRQYSPGSETSPGRPSNGNSRERSTPSQTLPQRQYSPGTETSPGRSSNGSSRERSTPAQTMPQRNNNSSSMERRGTVERRPSESSQNRQGSSRGESNNGKRIQRGNR